jgi:CheY-like chemotaxis protein
MAESAGPEYGSTFTVELPATTLPVAADTRQSRTREVSHASGPLQGYRLLVVDDHEDSRSLMATLLSSLGAEVDMASSVAEALERVSVVRPDAMLADIGMPGADGFDLIHEVRRRDSAAGVRLPIAAVTAYASEEDRAHVLAAGFDCHVSKPITTMALVTAILTMCSRKS